MRLYQKVNIKYTKAAEEKFPGKIKAGDTKLVGPEHAEELIAKKYATKIENPHKAPKED